MRPAISAFNKHDISRDACMLRGPLRKRGYDWWWHSFTAQDAQTGEDKAFFVEFFLCNPALAEDKEGPGSGPILGQLSENKAAGQKPSYVMVKAGCWGEDHCQLHRFFAWDQVDLHADASYQVQAADCLASEPGSRAASPSAKRRPPPIRNGCATAVLFPGICRWTSKSLSTSAMGPANLCGISKPSPCIGMRRA